MVSRRTRKIFGLTIVVLTLLTATGGIGTSLLSLQRLPDQSSLVVPTPDTIITIVPAPPTQPPAPLVTPTTPSLSDFLSTPAPSIPTPAALAPVVASAPIVAGPAGSQPLAAPTNLGVQQNAQGGVVGASTGQVACDDPGMMRVETSEGTVLAGISRDGGWSCQAALAQWQSRSSAGGIGVRYSPPQGARPAQLELVDAQGYVMPSFVTGAWTAP